MTRALVGPGLSVEAMDRHPKLKDFFRVTALATDRDGGVYVANLEAKDYPITATQWHPVSPARGWRDARLLDCACASTQCVAERQSWPHIGTSTWSHHLGGISAALRNTCCRRHVAGSAVSCRNMDAIRVQFHDAYTGRLSCAGEERVRVCSAPAHSALARSGELLLANCTPLGGHLQSHIAVRASVPPQQA